MAKHSSHAGHDRRRRLAPSTRHRTAPLSPSRRDKSGPFYPRPRRELSFAHCAAWAMPSGQWLAEIQIFEPGPDPAVRACRPHRLLLNAPAHIIWQDILDGVLACTCGIRDVRMGQHWAPAGRVSCARPCQSMITNPSRASLVGLNRPWCANIRNVSAPCMNVQSTVFLPSTVRYRAHAWKVVRSRLDFGHGSAETQIH